MALVDVNGDTVAPKVMVAVPCGEMVQADFAYDLARMVGYTTLTRPAIQVLLYHIKGTYLPRARATLANEAVAQGCSHILWLDSDMRFPKDTLLRLLEHGQAVVAANYPTRQPPFLPTAMDNDYQPVYTGEGLAEVRACGMGVMLTSCEVFHKIGKPYFALGYNKKSDDYVGEDVFFCEAVRKAGLRVQVDWALSAEVAHCGAYTFDMRHATATLNALHGESSGVK
jgi:hypothetical protein